MKISEVGFVFSQHHSIDNVGREAAINANVSKDANIIAKFFWDKGHKEGAEWHWICDNGIIIVTNAEKCDGKYVTTKLIARPAQLTRYTDMGLKNELNEQTRKMRKWLVPQRLLGLARTHQKNGLNNR